MARFRTRLAAAALSVTVLAGCSAVPTAASGSAGANGGATSTSSGAAAVSLAAAAADTVFDETAVHTVDLEVDADTLKQMLQTYVDSGEKEWITGTVTIDGQTFENVGIKLKGNSSLRQVSVDTPAAELPLRIRLDKYVDGQNIDGYSDFTVRSNSSETSMNEAVALNLLGDAGLATENAVATRFSVNGGTAVLRLTMQNLDDTWVEQNFPDAGADSVLYKSDADGSWAWQGADADYSSSFSVESGDDNYTPLIELLDLLNNGTAEEIAAKLPNMLDIDSFATYLAFEDLIDNFDDIDGPGNNSYLFWDSATKKFTVVAWDHNLAFGTQNVGGGGGQRGGAQNGGPNGGQGMQPPANGQANGGQANGGQAGGGRGGMSMNNPLSTAFLANTEWKALYDAAAAKLKADLIDSGTLATTVDQWTSTITADASDLVPAATVTSEADKITAAAS
jgi:spore coat protein CotH